MTSPVGHGFTVLGASPPPWGAAKHLVHPDHVIYLAFVHHEVVDAPPAPSVLSVISMICFLVAAWLRLAGLGFLLDIAAVQVLEFLGVPKDY